MMPCQQCHKKKKKKIGEGTTVHCTVNILCKYNLRDTVMPTELIPQLSKH